MSENHFLLYGFSIVPFLFHAIVYEKGDFSNEQITNTLQHTYGTMAGNQEGKYQKLYVL